MDPYKYKHFGSESQSSRPSLSTLHLLPSNPFTKLYQFVQEKYNQRLQSLEHFSEEFKNSFINDPAIQAMRASPITEKFIDSRMNEIFHSAILSENEQTISSLQNELMIKKAETLKFEQQIFALKLEMEKYEDSFRMNSVRESGANRENYREMWEKERQRNEMLEKEVGGIRKELSKTREIFQENEKLQRYCEQLESDRERWQANSGRTSDMKNMVEASKQAGIETIKELQSQFKKKSKLLKKKIIEQKEHIENLENELISNKNLKTHSSSRDHLPSSEKINELKEIFEKREQEIIEKHKAQILNLQEKYQKLLEEKVQEIQGHLNSQQRGISKEEHSQILKQKKEIENQLFQATQKNSITTQKLNESAELKSKLELANQQISQLENEIFALKTQQEFNDFRKSSNESERLTSEVNAHNDTKIRLKKAETKIAEQNYAIKELEENSKVIKELMRSKESFAIDKLSQSKLWKIKNAILLLRSQMSNFKVFAADLMKNSLAEMVSKTKEIIPRFANKTSSGNNSKLSLLITENQKLSSLLRSNSEAFDRLQEEVKNESSKIKMKNRNSIEKAVKECKDQFDKELEDLKLQNKHYKDMLEKANQTLKLEGNLSKQLKNEVESLRAERENIKKKQQALEEKITMQNNNFKTQLRSKQQELDLFKSQNFS